MSPMKLQNDDRQHYYRAIPAVQDLLLHSDFRQYPIDHRYLKIIIQQEIHQLRQRIADGRAVVPEKIPTVLVGNIAGRLKALSAESLGRTINASGIILHTNMGRAPLPPAARDHLMQVLENYCNIEIDLGSGRRGNRVDHVEALICLITGAEAAVVVNNCAAGVLLALNSLANRKEVPVSRGELVEIGGSFRMPDVMKSSGSKMIEVGTTNKTHLQDYEKAITPKTAALLKVHTSNYRIRGFTKTVEIEALASLAHSRQLPLIYDMGSGVMEDLQEWGYPHEPVAREMIAAGVDLLIFSGDKILGGPQAGIIAGKKSYIDRCKKNHLTRALRCDKLIFAALEAVLRLYLQPSTLPQHLPVAAMLTVSPDELHDRASRFCKAIKNSDLSFEVVESYSQMGSGALPLEKIPSIAIRLTAKRLSPGRLADRLRKNNPPIVGYIQDEALMLNLRTVREDELSVIAEALNNL